MYTHTKDIHSQKITFINLPKCSINLLLSLNLLLLTHELKMHTCVVRGRDISLGIRGFTIWCEFYSMKMKRYIYIEEEEDGILQKEKIRIKKNLLIYKTLFM